MDNIIISLFKIEDYNFIVKDNISAKGFYNMVGYAQRDDIGVYSRNIWTGDRHMRRKDKEITDRSAIDEILNEAQVCRLALSDGNIPYIIPMNFGYDGTCLYLHSAREGKKLDIIKGNNSVCFEVDIKSEVIRTENSCSWSMKYCSVIGFGKAYIVDDFNGKKHALDVIMGKYSGGEAFNYPEAAVNNVAVIKVEIEAITGKKSGY